MIHIDRNRVPVPAVLISASAERERARAKTFFAQRKRRTSKRYQERFEWNWKLLHDVRPALDHLFQDKCAFCETEDSSRNPLDIGHFRPVSEIVDPFAKKPSSVDGYWWLAYEWENLYLICTACNERKQTAFPIRGTRATPGTRGATLKGENPLLIDPCVDKPEEHLSFMLLGQDGMVAARTEPPADYDRGQASIAIFSLNRDELIERRRVARATLHKEWSVSLQRNFTGPQAARFTKLLEPSRPHLGCLKELTFHLVRDLAETKRFQTLARVVDMLDAAVPELRELAPRAAAIRPSEPRRASRPEGTHPPQGRRAPTKMRSAHGWYLRRVEIRNFKAIRRLDLDISRGTSGEKGWETGWKVLLGENGTGKSTVLQAIVLACMGDNFLKVQRIAPRSLLRRQGNGKTAAKGLVKLYWVDRLAPTAMRFTSTKCTFSGEVLPNALVMRAYGATRHLPRGRHKASREALPKDVENLFDPFLPVCDANGWLLSIRGAKAFGSAALSLKDLLGLTPRTRLSRQGGKVRVRVGGIDVALDELSAGYQSVVVLATDIMAGVHGQAHDLRFASGIVLIDELDAHLHPRWKMQIVASLRRTFPGIQFVVTTHEPLCLRGLKTGEITVMRRQGRTIQVLSDVPSPEGLRVDQLLTSPLFGLHSTVDPEADRDFQRYYQLLGKTSLTEEEERERRTLSDRLTQAGILGTPVVGHTRRDQLIYEAVDQYLAKEPMLSLTDRTQFSEETKQKVAHLWTDVLAEA